MRHRKNFLYFVCAFTLLSSFSTIAAAAVSVGPGCDFPSIPAAIAAGGGRFVNIHVLRTYVSPPIQLQGDFVQISGGYANCNDPAPMPGRHSTIDAFETGSPGIDVLSGTLGSTIVWLVDMTVTGADVAGDGGGIRYRGHGEVKLTRTFVFGNQAENGGGIDINPDGPYSGPDGTGYSRIELKAGSFVSANFAHHDGGGIRLQGGSRLVVVENDVNIENNFAGVDAEGNDDPNVSDDDGGGVQVIGPARADIGALGHNGRAVIGNNQATRGAGISIRGGTFAGPPGGVVRLFTKDPAHVTRIENNVARELGGGIYLGAITIGNTGTRLCGFGYGINDNTAVNGAAIYSSNGAGDVLFTGNDLDNPNCGLEPATTAWGAVNSIAVRNTILRNTAGLNDGAVVDLEDENMFTGEQLEAQHNVGRELFNVLFASGANLQLSQCLLANNTVRDNLILVLGTFTHTAELHIDGCTIANNILGPSFVLNPISTRLVLQHSILWQPGNVSTSAGAVNDTVTDVIASEISSLTYDTHSGVLLVTDPGFVESPTNSDFHLRPDSPAVDYTGTNFAARDLDNNARPIALLRPATPYDIGAFELQQLTPSGCATSDGILCSGFDP